MVMGVVGVASGEGALVLIYLPRFSCIVSLR
jgi:hypothetical protein